jgi:hypothetical protein
LTKHKKFANIYLLKSIKTKMSEQSLLQPQFSPEFHETDEDIRTYRGVYENETFSTNIPEWALKTWLDDNGKNVADGSEKYPNLIIPAEIDKLLDGEYFVRRSQYGKYLNDDLSFGIATDKDGDRYLVKIGDTYHSSVGSYGGFPEMSSFLRIDQPYSGNINTRTVMEPLGFGFSEDGSINSIPTPLTLVRIARQLGVNIELVDGGQLGGSEYLAIFAKGKYPVATGDHISYSHDIRDDHLTAMVLGGQYLSKALASSANEAIIDGSKEVINERTNNIDEFTATLRLITGARDDDRGRKYDERKLVRLGVSLGISENEVNGILRVSFAHLRELELQIERSKS